MNPKKKTNTRTGTYIRCIRKYVRFEKSMILAGEGERRQREGEAKKDGACEAKRMDRRKGTDGIFIAFGSFNSHNKQSSAEGSGVTGTYLGPGETGDK